MKIGKSELQEKYGIDLPVGLFKINTSSDGYVINSVKDDTDGCILVGTSRSGDSIVHSRDAYTRLLESLDTSDHTIEVRNP